MRRRSLLAGCFLLAGCAGDPTSDEKGVATTGPEPTCLEGLTFASIGGRDACIPRLPAAACEAGTMPVLGEDECAPVGWSACPDGFVADPSGWGCADVVPDAPCEGATMDRIGLDACQPIGDCAAPFPPPEATLIVDDDFSDAEVDATHKKTIGDALAAAPDGAVIAIAAGMYAESLVPPVSVTLAGACAADVEIVGDGASPGVDVGAAAAVTLRGVTLRGHGPGAWVSPGGGLVLEGVLVDEARDEGVRVDGGSLGITESVVRKTAPSAPGGQTVAVLAYGGAIVDIVESAITDNLEGGVGVVDPGTEATVRRTVLRRTTAQKIAGGVAIKAFLGAHISLEECVVAESHTMGVLAGEPGTEVSIARSVVRDTKTSDFTADPIAFAVSIRKGASLTIEDSALVRNPVVGLSADDGGSISGSRVVAREGLGLGWLGVGLGAVATLGGHVDLAESAFVGNTGGAAFTDGPGATLDLSRTLLVGTTAGWPHPDAPEGGGGTGLAATDGAVASLRACSILTGAEISVGALGAGSHVEIQGVLVDGTQPTGTGLYGHGLMVKGQATARVAASWFRSNAGVGLVFAEGAGAVVQGAFVSANAFGVHVQDGVELAEDDTGALLPGSALVSTDTSFWDNVAKVGTGTLPLPTPAVPAP